MSKIIPHHRSNIRLARRFFLARHPLLLQFIMVNQQQYIFTLETAQNAHKNGTLRQWLLDYLTGEGNNPKLAAVIESEKDPLIDLIESDLSTLKRVMGPEADMFFKEDVAKWNQRVSDFSKLIDTGFRPPPIILTNFWDGLQIADGAHRFEALKKSGFTKYWTIVCLSQTPSR